MSLNFENISSKSAISLSFTESPLFIRPYASDDSSNFIATTLYVGLRLP
jgi:hypothetical protein